MPTVRYSIARLLGARFHIGGKTSLCSRFLFRNGCNTWPLFSLGIVSTMQE